MTNYEIKDGNSDKLLSSNRGQTIVNILSGFPDLFIWDSAINSAYLTSQPKLPYDLMLKIISFVCIGLCVVVIAFVIKIYRELPKPPKRPKKKKENPWY